MADTHEGPSRHPQANEGSTVCVKLGRAGIGSPVGHGTGIGSPVGICGHGAGAGETETEFSTDLGAREDG